MLEGTFFYYMAKIMRTIKNIPVLSPVHPDTPFYLPFLINPKVQFTEDHLWYLWCTTCLYVMPVLIPTEAMYHYLMEPNNHGSLIWTALQWYSPLEKWRKELEKALHELYKFKFKGDLFKFKTVFILHKPYETDPRTNFLISKPQCTLWETVNDCPLDPRISQELKSFMGLMNFHNPKKTTISTTCISHGNLPPQFQPVELGESSTQAADDQMVIDEYEAQWIKDHPHQPEGNSSNPTVGDREYEALFPCEEEDSPDQNMSPSHEPIKKHY